MTDLPSRAFTKEEGPREGFQIEKKPIPTGEKIRLVDALSDTGLRYMQITSFVHPREVPGMADAEAMPCATPKPRLIELNSSWAAARAVGRWPRRIVRISPRERSW